MKVEFSVNIRIRKPVAEVFDAVVNPKKLSGYFTESASAPLTEGATAMWKFEGYPKEFPVFVRKVVANKLIEYEWESMEGGYNTKVTMTFEAASANSTLITVTESGWRETEKGVKSSYQNCGGWMHMMCCLKAYLEYNINLRTGSFESKDFEAVN
jgi:uncharacterized protein YndB with AHSA1/START domain